MSNSKNKEKEKIDKVGFDKLLKGLIEKELVHGRSAFIGRLREARLYFLGTLDYLNVGEVQCWLDALLLFFKIENMGRYYFMGIESKINFLNEKFDKLDLEKNEVILGRLMGFSDTLHHTSNYREKVHFSFVAHWLLYIVTGDKLLIAEANLNNYIYLQNSPSDKEDNDGMYG